MLIIEGVKESVTKWDHKKLWRDSKNFLKQNSQDFRHFKP
jgi:hypothetical protein